MSDDGIIKEWREGYVPYGDGYAPWNDNCNKGILGCFCRVGFPYNEMCPACRDKRAKNDIYSYCVCGPDDQNEVERTSGEKE